ncbi:MAG: hypothetical protein E7362_01290 [Clostridiales bacterium]|nr:hypothetical protein [Clostridiales bacterium]
MSKKLGVVLGAGGARGVAHIGFLQALEEAGIKPDMITGCSMGSVVGACYCYGLTPENMYERVSKLKLGDIFDLSLNPWKSGALLRANKMYEQIKKIIGASTFNELKIPFKCVAVDLYTGDLKVFDGDKEVAKCVAASCSIPGIFRPVEMDGLLLVDGGVKCRVPMEEMKQMNPDVIVAVDVLGVPQTTDKKFNMLTVLLRSFEIMDGELIGHKKLTSNPDLFIEPELGDMSQYKFKDIQKAYEIGYKAGLDNVKKIKELIEE